MLIKNTHESGRSMVEILGVLAIIGILSIAGIIGFRYAMIKLHANTLMHEATKRAVVVAGQICFTKGMPSLDEFTENVFNGASFENIVYGEDGLQPWTIGNTKFTLSINNVEENVCNQMKIASEGMLKAFAPETCTPGQTNNVKLTYNNDLSLDNTENSSEETGACPASSVCGENCCNEGYACEDGHCVDPCSGTLDTDCIQHVAQNGTCIIRVDAEKHCGDNKICGISGDCTTCISGYTFWNGNCLESCANGQFYNTEGTCTNCPQTIAEATTQELCLGCFETSFWTSGGQCKAACTTGKYHILSGTCNSCTTDTRSETTARECSQACGDTRMTIYVEDPDSTIHYYCAIKTCSSGKFHQIDGQNNGVCMPCSYANAVRTSASECALCTENPRYHDGTYCRLCPTNIANATSADSCSQCFGGQFTNNVCQQ